MWIVNGESCEIYVCGCGYLPANDGQTDSDNISLNSNTLRASEHNLRANPCKEIQDEIKLFSNEQHPTTCFLVCGVCGCI